MEIPAGVPGHQVRFESFSKGGRYAAELEGLQASGVLAGMMPVWAAGMASPSKSRSRTNFQIKIIDLNEQPEIGFWLLWVVARKGS